MKQRILPIGFLTLLLISLVAVFLTNAGPGDQDRKGEKQQYQDNLGGKDYLASIRNNQFTGKIDPKDVIKARTQLLNQAQFKSSSNTAFTWNDLGPDNMGGRTRGLIFDNRDASGKTLYAGSTTGGIFKSTNGGSNWSKANTGDNSIGMNVSCMVQDENGTIYVGTGEGFGTQTRTATGQLGYEGGFIGQGIFKSGNNDLFSVIPGTEPTMQGEVMEWAYINELAIDETGNRLFAATNTGLKYASLSNLSSWQFEFARKVDSLIYNRAVTIDSVITCDSFKITDGNLTCYGSTGWNINILSNDTIGSPEVIFDEYVPFEGYSNVSDVKVSSSGYIITTFNNRIYVSSDGNTNHFVNKSIYPTNPESVRLDNIEWTAKLRIMDKQGNVLLDSVTVFNITYDWHTDYKYAENSLVKGYPNSVNGGRTEFAIAPSNPNIVYAVVAKGTSTTPEVNRLEGIYLSENGGQSWRTVAPGGSVSLNILGSTYGSGNTKYFVGDFANSIAVFPGNPDKILVGGVNLWLGQKINNDGFYNWESKSISQAASINDGIFNQFYCHKYHHSYVFNPANSNQFIAATSGGLFLGKISGNEINFQSVNKNYSSAQFYSLDISTMPNEYVGGIQDNGPVYNKGKGGTGKSAEDMWRVASFDSKYSLGADGGSVAFSTFRAVKTDGSPINPAVFYQKCPYPENEALSARMRRSESLGFDYSANFLSSSITDDRFITPMLLWESYNDQLSQITTEWVADKDYESGAIITARSNIQDQPFHYTLESAVSEDDTLQIKDIYTSKLFIGMTDKVWMSLNSMDFAATPTWFLISDKTRAGVDGKVQSMAASTDGNYLWVGTMTGNLYRISGIGYAYDANKADVTSANCVIATTRVVIEDGLSQSITSISVDPADPGKIMITLGNYGNTDYVYYCSNGLSDYPTFTSVQGNLPQAPAYSCLLEMDPETSTALIGTELGLWATDDIASGNWYRAAPEIGAIPVMAIKQQTLYKGTFTITFYDPVTNEPFYEKYLGVENYKDIYIATHGRGVFRNDVVAVGLEESYEMIASQHVISGVYPNPATKEVTLHLVLQTVSPVVFCVYDLSGRMVFRQDLGLMNSGNHKPLIRFGKLNPGTYLLQVEAGKVTETRKLIIVN